MGKTKSVWMVALQSAADDLGMGDQLAKGWADSKASEMICRHKRIGVGGICLDCGERAAITLYPIPWGAPGLNPTEAEVQAEEDMLP